jgi:hypothetical protein
MNIRCCVTLAACECLGTGSHSSSDKLAALFVQSGLTLNCVKHERMGRLVSRFGRSHDPPLEVRRNLQRGCYRAGHALLRAVGSTKVTPTQALFKSQARCSKPASERPLADARDRRLRAKI